MGVFIRGNDWVLDKFGRVVWGFFLNCEEFEVVCVMVLVVLVVLLLRLLRSCYLGMESYKKAYWLNKPTKVYVI